MKNILLFISLLIFSQLSIKAQTNDSDLVRQAGLNYIEGFYEGDTLKLKNGISSELFKFGYWKGEDGNFGGDQMTYKQAIDYSKGVLENERFVSSAAPKKVEIFDVQEHIAAIKITAWWGIDYALLSRKEGVWKIEQVLWQGPIRTIK
ncbi:MAG: nuclear transport factor 2 family protein [Balneolaceae bacterium]